MTEITENNEAQRRYLVDPVAFSVALFGGPILFTLATFWMLFIPVFALVIGGLPYLLIGTPVLLWHLRRNPPGAGAIAGLALCAFVAAWLVFVLWLAVSTPRGTSVGAAYVLPFGMIFASCWGACFGWLYRLLALDFYTQPRPA